MYIFNEIPIKNVNVNETIMKSHYKSKKRRKRKEKLFYSYFDVFIYRKNLYFVIYHGGTFRFRWDLGVACEKNHEILKIRDARRKPRQAFLWSRTSLFRIRIFLTFWMNFCKNMSVSNIYTEFIIGWFCQTTDVIFKYLVKKIQAWQKK